MESLENLFLFGVNVSWTSPYQNEHLQKFFISPLQRRYFLAQKVKKDQLTEHDYLQVPDSTIWAIMIHICHMRTGGQVICTAGSKDK